MTRSPEGEPVADSLEAINERFRALNQLILGMRPGPERDEMGYAAQHELDDRWEALDYMGLDCLVTGTGIWMRPVDEDEEEADEDLEAALIDAGDTLEQQAQPRIQLYATAFGKTGLEAVSEGFEYWTPSDETPSMIWYRFQTDIIDNRPNPSVIESKTMLAHFGHDCRIMPLPDEGPSIEDPDEYAHNVLAELEENAFDLTALAAGYQGGDVQQILSKHSDAFARLLRWTGFRRMNHKQQIYTVDRLLANTEAETRIRESEAIMEPQYAYISHPSLYGQSGVEYEKIGLHGDILVSGICVALGMIGRERLQTKAIRCDKDLVTKYAGMVLTVDLRDALELHDSRILERGSLLHVPISGQDFVALFGRSEQDAA
ncbi:MAG: hypothetical protein JWO41_933 [Candidatus Saccharibacteria bacterium]|nr:hypothetical protein [Candidatus Saccharibacteria bacterium]